MKILTALSNKKFLISNPNIPLGIGYVVLAMGIIDLVYRLSQNSIAGFSDVLNPLSFMFIGIANLVSAKVVKWIVTNSSWEERFENTSSTKHKVIYLLFSIMLVLCLVMIILYE